ncbi:MAG: F0F1 ATP synthase subunit gamma [Alphaproteobacteria bacterium]|nr:F0F1 ATP synthase subunit gamma [Alphaproteobacteria bacterium]MCD8520462.1 F0F1 ATP synthase subunit gamma [Alphaproteobacteria bacterium]MCD8571155.1 F0F1 ATP synthase subunit gamma [Alphaproteobacteria bacterium]
MPSLRTYRDRIKSVKSTRKITSAMKMVAASKLRRAQEQAEASQPYAQAMADMLSRVAKNVVINASSSKLLVGTGDDKRHLIVAVTADRGLCGGFNATLVKAVREQVRLLQAEDKEVYLVCVGRKARDLLKRSFGQRIWQSFTGITGKSRVEFVEANQVTQFILEKFEANEFDVCTLAYNKFENVLSQPPVLQQIIPFDLSAEEPVQQDNKKEQSEKVEFEGPKSPYDFEPEEERILNALLPRNIGVQIYRALLDSSAGEQAARMTAMDNATRNAGEMIKDLTLQYNRARQAYITKELIEIISGAEAL